MTTRRSRNSGPLSSRSPRIEAARKTLLPNDTTSTALNNSFGVSIQTSSSISQRFGVTIFVLEDSFEYVNGWPDTIPDNLINPILDFSTSEAVLEDSFETADAWP